jgi:hypothetical protein
MPDAAGTPLDGSSADDGLTPMAIPIGNVSAIATTFVLLALVASGIAIPGNDRPKRHSTPDIDVEEPSAEE